MKKLLIALYEMFYEWRRVLYLRIFYRLRIMTPYQTVSFIEKHYCSTARFGDGEFDLILGSRDLGFQEKSADIQQALIKVMESKNKNLLLCVPRCMNTIEECNEHAGSFWINWGRNGHHEQIIQMIRSHAGKGYLFGDAQITRPYIDWTSDKRAKRLFPKLKSLWDKKRIIIAEGEQSRMGVGNDLFDNAASIKRVLCPATGAFSRKEEIKRAILSHYQGELVLLALGPTATVLAGEFADMGIQALDIGNIDIEYEWFLRDAKERIPIPGKYTNEAKNGLGRTFTDCTDEKYLSQIVARVGC